MRILYLALAAGALSCGVAAQAESADRSQIKLAISFGSLGIGPEVTYRPTPLFGVRASALFFGISHSADIDGIHYDGKLKLGTYGAMVDAYPFANGFRISGGARYARNRLRLRATPNGPITIGNVSYTPAQVGMLAGDIETKDFEPIVTVGYGGTVAKGVSLGIDAGVMFQGTPKISRLTATSPMVSAVNLLDEQSQIQDDIRKYKYYPVVQASVGYRF